MQDRQVSDLIYKLLDPVWNPFVANPYSSLQDSACAASSTSGRSANVPA